MKKKLPILDIIIPLILIGILVWIYFHFNLASYLNLDYFLTQKNYFDNYGIKGILIILLIYASVGFIYIPIAFLSLFSGYLYGTLLGGIVAYIGSILNIMVAFLWARFLLKKFFIKIKNKVKVLQKTSAALEKNSKSFIFYSRLFFITPYNGLNIVCGISDINIKDYFLYSAAGSTVQAFFYSYMGNAVEDIISGKDITKQLVITLLILAGFVAFVKIGKKFFK